LHGLTGTPYEVRPPAEALARNGFACVAPLLPGHGEPAERLEATSAEAWLDAAETVFDDLQKTHERVYVLGLSLGGLLALALAARRPVSGLLVLATPLRLRLLPRLAAPVLARFVRFLPKHPAIRDPEALARHPGTDRMPLASVQHLLRLQKQVEGELSQVVAPIHLIFSRQDPAVDPRNGLWILEGVGSVQRSLSYLDRSFHVITVDVERESVRKACVGFLLHLEQLARVDGEAGAS
jgi:carboxylesterase